MAVLFFYSHFVFFIFALYSLIVIITYLQNVVLKETVSPSSISNIHSGCSNFKPNTKTKCIIYHFLSIFDLKMSLFVCYLSVFCLILVLCGVSVDRSNVFCVVFCRSLFVFLFFIFPWKFYCVIFFITAADFGI